MDCAKLSDGCSPTFCPRQLDCPGSGAAQQEPRAVLTAVSGCARQGDKDSKRSPFGLNLLMCGR